MALKIVENNISEEFNRLINTFSQSDKVMERSGVRIVGLISRRTDAGKSVSGAPFINYSTGYKKKRQRTGRSTKPDLQFSGEMLRSMKFVIDERVNDVRVIVDFPRRFHSRSRISLEELAEAQHKTRPFFDLSAREIAQENLRILADLERLFKGRGF